MGAPLGPDALFEVAADVVAFTVLAAALGTNGAPPRGQVRVDDVLRGQLSRGNHVASFPPPSDASWYAIRGGGDAALAAWQAQPRTAHTSGDRLIAVVYPQPDGSLAVESRACVPDHDGHRARITWGADAAITLITAPADDPDAFEAMTPEERRERSGGWTRFPLRSGRRLDTLLGFATDVDLGVFGCADAVDAGAPLDTSVLLRNQLVEVAPVLARLVETDPDVTARALWEYGGRRGALDRVTAALRTGTWPTTDDPAEEAAAFAHQLLRHGRVALGDRHGVCWEYRGRVRAQLSPPPTDRMRDLETLYARIRAAGMIQLNVEMWEQHGAAHATTEQRATMEADLAQASREREAATAALTALVARTRDESPAELDAWTLAHHAFLSLYLHDCAERGEADSTAASVARAERAAWADVRAGTRAFVDENLAWVPIDPDRYRAHFGIDPRTLERVG